MVQQEKGFFVDDAIPTRILDIVRAAREYLTLVTPYVDLTGHLQHELRLAVEENKVRLTVVLRRDPGDKIGGDKGKESIRQLTELGAQVKAVEDLHAKIYLSESAVVVSSMNLLSSSWSNSHEFGMEVPEGPIADSVRTYVSDTLIKLGTDVAPPAAPATGAPTKRPAGKKKSVAEKRRPYGARTKKRAPDGHCIRCGASISLDPSHPLCPKCYGVWALFENREYLEEHCHACGKKHEATYAKPLCRACYRRLAS